MLDSRQNLIDSAVRVLAVNSRATLADIAEAAGVQRVTLHRHFGSRDALMREIALHSLEEMDRVSNEAAQGATSYTVALRSIVEALVPVGDRFHFLWQQQEVWADEKVAERIAKDNEELTELIQHVKDEGGIAADISNAWVLSMIEAVVFAAQNVSHAGDIAVNEAGRLAARTLFDGIMKPAKGRPRKKRWKL